MREDWIECEIGDVFDVVTGNTPSKANPLLYGGNIPFIKPPEINNKEVEDASEFLTEEGAKVARILPKYSVLITCIGNLGRVAMNSKFEVAFNQQINALKPNKFVYPKYIYYEAQSSDFRNQLEELSTAVTVSLVNKTNFSKVRFPLPPLPEQRAIVKKLESLFSSLDAGVADLKKAQQQLKIYRQAVLKKAFEGELTNSEMESIRLANLTTILGDGLHGTPKYSDSGEYYFINGNNLREGKIILKPETKRVDKSEFEKYKKNLGNSTVLVSINGTIGNTAFYNNENVVLGKSACYFNLNNDIDKYYVRYNLTTKRFLHYAVNNATGSTIMNVGLKTMREYLVPVPKNRSEQHQIVKQIESRLSVCDSIEQNIKESLEKAEALRQSILKKAFEGNLLTAAELAACKQAADYEPASLLLERIKAEQQNTKTKSIKEKLIKKAEVAQIEAI